MTALTSVHVVLSLAGIGSGFIVVFGLIAAKRLDGLTALFLASTVATSLTGFLFPFHKLLPSHVVGIMSLRVEETQWAVGFPWLCPPFPVSCAFRSTMVH